MYYKEEIVDGILCYKHTPDGEWIPMSPEKMTRKIMQLRIEVEILKSKLERESRRLHEPI